MNERSLSRKVATAVVDALKARGHILVVKGGSEALVRELDALMAKTLEEVAPRLVPRTPVTGEVTSTFGDEAADEAVEEMVERVTTSLIDSEHVEDVFAADNEIGRDVFRVVRDALLRAPAAGEEEAEVEAGSLTVRLDTLGYVASTVAKRADDATLREALERAAEAAGAALSGYEPAAREASFVVHDGGPDQKLDLEEAVADELQGLVDSGLVQLPTIERRVALARALTAAEQRALRPRVEAAAERTLMRTGCGVQLELSSDAVDVTFTPLSDVDAREVDRFVALFARDVAALAGEPPQAREEAKAERPSAAPRRRAVPAAAQAAKAEAPAAAPRTAREPARPKPEQEAPRVGPEEAAPPAKATGARKPVPAAREATKREVVQRVSAKRKAASPRRASARAATAKRTTRKAPAKKG